MKKIITLLAIISLLASCSTKISLVKRKYNKGYFVSISKHKNAIASANEKQKREHQTSEKSSQAVQITKVENTDISRYQAELNNSSAAATTQINQYNTFVNNANTVKKQQLKKGKSLTQTVENKWLSKVLKPGKLISNIGKKQNATSGGGDDTNTILLVILCLFWWLNLVAVYLHDSKAITMNFWITLLLDITVIFGIIFSILVVLDIINLA